MSGKGSRPRPFSVSNDEYSKRWDAIFKRDGLDDPSESSRPKTESCYTMDDDGEINKVTRANQETQEAMANKKGSH